MLNHVHSFTSNVKQKAN